MKTIQKYSKYLLSICLKITRKLVHSSRFITYALSSMLFVWLGRLFGAKYSKMDQVKIFGRQSLKNFKYYQFKFFKGYVPQILLGPFLHTFPICWVDFFEFLLFDSIFVFLSRSNYMLILSSFWFIHSFYNPCKHQKIWSFLVFSEDMKWEDWLKMGHPNTAQKMKFSITDFFSKCDQICSFLRI